MKQYRSILFLRSLIHCLILALTSLVLFTPSLRAQSYGIGGFDLASPADRIIAFDYDGSGKADHLLIYRPGTGIVWILANSNGSFYPVYTSSNGIGGYDLKSPNDRIFALDYSGHGRLNYLVCYRPGSGIIYILQNNGGDFSAILESSSGIGGFDLMSTSDIGFAYDATLSNSYNSMVFYRPGTGVVYVIENSFGQLITSYLSGYGGPGIGTFDLTSTADRLTPYSIPGELNARYLIGDRPGSGLAAFIAGGTNTFGNLYLSTSGIGGFDLQSADDQIMSFDYSDTGLQDHLLVYRPGSGIAWILGFVGPLESPTFFSPIYASGSGIGGYDLLSTSDRAIAFDYNSSGYADHLLFYRPGTGVVKILSNVNGTYTSVYSAGYLPPGYGAGQITAGMQPF